VKIRILTTTRSFEIEDPFWGIELGKRIGGVKSWKKKGIRQSRGGVMFTRTLTFARVSFSIWTKEVWKDKIFDGLGHKIS